MMSFVPGVFVVISAQAWYLPTASCQAAETLRTGCGTGLLQEGQEIYLIDGRGTISTFTVTQILRYQALESGNTSTRFLDLQSRTSITSAGLFTKIYSRLGQVVFQTCIQAGDNPSWGRLFVIATPSD
jgi:hypothetical protein